MIFFLCVSFLLFSAIDGQQITSKDCKCTLPAFPRIIGGDQAAPNSIPWQISLAQYNQHICGGTILNHNFVMTAAHCVVSASPDQLTVRVGLHRLSDPNIAAKTYAVRRITVHSRYFESNRAISDPGDIALLEIDGSIPFSQSVQPACLPERFENYDDKVGSLLASGWGSITRTVRLPSGQLANAKLSNTLKEAVFNYLNPNSPNLVNVLGINPNSVPGECSENQLVCINPVTPGDSVCNGDSGGPLMHVRNGIATVVGVASYVTGLSTSNDLVVFCNGGGAYSRVSSYLTFIGNHVGKDNYCRY